MSRKSIVLDQSGEQKQAALFFEHVIPISEWESEYQQEIASRLLPPYLLDPSPMEGRDVKQQIENAGSGKLYPESRAAGI